jgi:hypothetical protein
VIGGEEVYVTGSGLLGTHTSSRRYKEDIADMGAASEVLLSLRPVTFHYKKADDDGQKPIQFGLIAEEVEKICPDLVARDAKGEIRSVHYSMVNAMLLNEFQKEHRRVEEQHRKLEEQEATIAQLKKGMEVLTASLKEQAAQIQKVSAQIEAGKPAAQTVANNQ